MFLAERDGRDLGNRRVNLQPGPISVGGGARQPGGSIEARPSLIGGLKGGLPPNAERLAGFGIPTRLLGLTLSAALLPLGFELSLPAPLTAGSAEPSSGQSAPRAGRGTPDSLTRNASARSMKPFAKMQTSL
jgi:hypothetical protein